MIINWQVVETGYEYEPWGAEKMENVLQNSSNWTISRPVLIALILILSECCSTNYILYLKNVKIILIWTCLSVSFIDLPVLYLSMSKSGSNPPYCGTKPSRGKWWTRTIQTETLPNTGWRRLPGVLAKVGLNIFESLMNDSKGDHCINSFQIWFWLGEVGFVIDI